MFTTQNATAWLNLILAAKCFHWKRSRRRPRAISRCLAFTFATIKQSRWPGRLRRRRAGELEITDVLNEYLRRGQLRVQRLSRGFAWLDAGTSSSLHDAASYVQTIEKRQGIKIGCPEEAALRRSFISMAQFETLTTAMPACEYRDYLKSIASEIQRMGT